MMIEFPIPVGLGNFLASGARVAPVWVRSEGADGNARASHVGKETLAGVTPACCFLLGIRKIRETIGFEDLAVSTQHSALMAIAGFWENWII